MELFHWRWRRWWGLTLSWTLEIQFWTNFWYLWWFKNHFFIILWWISETVYSLLLLFVLWRQNKFYRWNLFLNGLELLLHRIQFPKCCCLNLRDNTEKIGTWYFWFGIQRIHIVHENGQWAIANISEEPIVFKNL